MKVVKQGLSAILTLALALMMTPIPALAVDSGSNSGVTAETIHPFTSTDDLIQSAYEELNELGVTQEAEKQNAVHVAKVEAASGMDYDQVKSYVYTQLMDNLETGSIDVSSLNLGEEEMTEVVGQVLYEYYLHNAITDLEYAVAAGKVTQISFTVSEGYGSAMQAIDEEFDTVIIEEVSEGAVELMTESAPTTMSAVGVGDVWTRIYGKTRVETCAEIVANSFESDSCDVVFVTTAWNFPDALAASSLAGINNAPIITVDKTLTEATATEIARVAADDAIIYIIGGEGAVSAAVATAIADIEDVAIVERISGKSRYETANAIYQMGVGSWSDTAIIANGANYADALAISSYAYATGTPIFLANKGVLSDDAAAAINENCSQVIIVGGAGAVPDSVLDQIDDTIPSLRLSGKTRVETAIKIAEWITGNAVDAEFQPETALSYDGMGVATAWSFADALTSVNKLGTTGSVLLLLDTKSKDYTLTNHVISSVSDQLTNAYIFGGTGAVSEAAANECVHFSSGTHDVGKSGDEPAISFEWEQVVIPVTEPQFATDANGNLLDANGNVTQDPSQAAVLNGCLIYNPESGEIQAGLTPEVRWNLTGITYTCGTCGETVTINDSEVLANYQLTYEIYYDLTTGQIIQAASTDEQPATSDTLIHYTQMQVATFMDSTFTGATDSNGNYIGLYSDSRDNGEYQVAYYYSMLSAFNADHAEYFGVSTDYWTSKNSEANPMAALKVLCNLDPQMNIPPAQMLQMVQMLPQAFMSYVFYYGGELLAMRDAAVEAVESVRGATDVQKLLILHDWLAENATFDMGSMLNIAGESSGNDPIQMTTFGALLSNQLSIMQNSEYYGGICLAYAAAYTYLVQAVYPEIYMVEEQVDTDGDGVVDVIDEVWATPAQVDAKGGDIVDFSQVMFYADTTETSLAGEGFGGSIFNNVHYFNAVYLEDAPTSTVADDEMVGKWFYVDSCYDDIYIECLSQYRAEADGSVYHSYFLVSPQTMGQTWADSIDYIDSLYDGYTYVAQVDANGNVTTPSDNVSTSHPDYDPNHPEYEKVKNPDEVMNDNTCYEDSWFSGAVSKIYNDGTNWYYVDSGVSASSYTSMMDEDGNFDIDFDQMEENGLSMDGMMHSSRVGVESQDVMKSRPMSSPDYWVEEEDDSEDTMGFDMTMKEDTYAKVLFDYGTGLFSTNAEIDLKAAVVEDFVYNEQFPGLTHSIGLYGGVIYFNLGNQIYAYDTADATCELFKEYNRVSATSDGRPFTASSYTLDSAGRDLRVEDNPVAALCVRTAYTPQYSYVDADGDGAPDTRVFESMAAAETMTVNIGTNYTFTTPSAENGYTAEAINYNPDYNLGLSDDSVNNNEEFLWCANIREDVTMSNWTKSTPGTDNVPCTAQNDGHTYVYNSAEGVYICSECNLHAVNVVDDVENGVVVMTAVADSGMSQEFINNNGGADSEASTTTEPVSPEREAATTQSGDITITVEPAEGYVVSEVSYLYEGATEKTVLKANEDGTYTLAKDTEGCLTVSAVFIDSGDGTEENPYQVGVTVQGAEEPTGVIVAGSHWVETVSTVEGEASTWTLVSCEEKGHLFNHEIESADYRVTTGFDCENPEYYKSCCCGVASTDSADIFAGVAIEHSDSETDEDSNCDACGKNIGPGTEDNPYQIGATVQNANEPTGATVANSHWSKGEAAEGETPIWTLVACTFDQEKATSDTQATSATCKVQATYYKTCTCGEKGTETFAFGELAAHQYTDDADTDCNVCGEPRPASGGDTGGDTGGDAGEDTGEDTGGEGSE